MRMSRQFGLAAALLLVAPMLTHAQRSSGMVSMPAPVVRAHAAPPSAAARHSGTARTAGNHPRAASASLNSNAAFDSLNFGGALTVQQLLDPFPGFGFDFEHLSAIDRDIAIKALIDPATQARLRIVERLARNNGFAPGFFLLDGGGSYAVPVDNDQQPQAQQPVIVVQQAPQQNAPQDMAMAEPAPEQAPLPDEGEFTLVTRQGWQVEAVAFTRMNDRIVYITPSGGRRSMAVTDLDPDATMHLNQERGTPLQLPPLIQLPPLTPRIDPTS